MEEGAKSVDKISQFATIAEEVRNIHGKVGGQLHSFLYLGCDNAVLIFGNYKLYGIISIEIDVTTALRSVQAGGQARGGVVVISQQDGWDDVSVNVNNSNHVRHRVV
jgi:hypothetical protein